MFDPKLQPCLALSYVLTPQDIYDNKKAFYAMPNNEIVIDFRPPKVGERFLDIFSEVTTACFNYKRDKPRFIVSAISSPLPPPPNYKLVFDRFVEPGDGVYAGELLADPQNKNISFNEFVSVLVDTTVHGKYAVYKWAAEEGNPK